VADCDFCPRSFPSLIGWNPFHTATSAVIFQTVLIEDSVLLFKQSVKNSL
jgi:hypothetical protein